MSGINTYICFMREDFKERTNELESELLKLVDENSEIRKVGRDKPFNILVDRGYGKTTAISLKYQKSYIEVSQRLFIDGTWRYRSFGRVVMSLNDPSYVIDHINGNVLDNRTSNLRICRQGQNVKNRRRSRNKTPYKGLVSVGRYLSIELQNEYKKHRVNFSKDLTEKIAAVIYDCWAKAEHKDFARLNFPTNNYSDEIICFINSIVDEFKTDIRNKNATKKPDHS